MNAAFAIALLALSANFGAVRGQNSIWDFILGNLASGGGVSNGDVVGVENVDKVGDEQNVDDVQSVGQTEEEIDDVVNSVRSPSPLFVPLNGRTQAKKRVVVDPAYNMGCIEPGTFPVAGDCSRFLVCQEAPEGSPGPLRGTRFKCPTGTRFGYLNLYDPASLLAFRLGVPLDSNSLKRSPLHYGRCLYKQQVNCPWEDSFLQGNRRRQRKNNNSLFSLLNLLPR